VDHEQIDVVRASPRVIPCLNEGDRRYGHLLTPFLPQNRLLAPLIISRFCAFDKGRIRDRPLTSPRRYATFLAAWP
jgi:hypothetical protein